MIAPLALAALAFACPASRVGTERYAGEQGSLHGIPWVATTNGAFAGHLFYWSATPWGRAHATRASIFTDVYRRRVNPKVLWIARRRTPAREISLRGRRLDAPGTFTSRYPVASGGQFPSYVEIPQAGCWRITVSAGGLSGSGVFAAHDTF